MSRLTPAQRQQLEEGKETGRHRARENARRRSRPSSLLVSPSPCLLVFLQRGLALVGALALTLVPAPARASEAGSRERTFLRALEVFDTAKSPQDYRESAVLLESLVAEGVRSGVVYYNLGNAWFRAGQYGRAIAAYRKAKPYRPRDPYLEANLRQALSVAPGRLPESPPPWWTHVLFWSGWLSYPVKAYTTFAALLLAAIVAGAALIFRRP